MVAQVAAGKKTYSLEQCIDIALKQNNDIKLAYSNIPTAAASLTNAFGNFLPSINANLAFQRYLKAPYQYNFQGILVPGAVPLSYYQSSIQAQYMIFNGFQREAKYSQAQSTLNYQYLQIKSTEQQIKINVYRQYIDIIKKQEFVTVRKENLKFGKEELQKLQAQFDVGALQIGPVYTQEAEVGQRELDLVTAENDLNIAKATLLTTLGIQPGEDAEFLETSLPKAFSDIEIRQFRLDNGDFPIALNSALTKRPDYAVYKLQIDAANSAITAARGAYYPSLSASGGWQWNNSQLDNFGPLGSATIGLNLSIPIFENFSVNYQIENAKMQVAQAEIKQTQLEQNIRSALQTSYLNLEASEKLIDITGRSLKAAELNKNNYKERFDAGAATITEYLDASNRLIAAQINRINAIYSYFQAQKELLFAAGKLE
jgi:outer membrane protein